MALKGLSGKTALVTGAGRGIGAAVVERLLEEGCRVVAADLNADLLARYADDARVATIAMDVARQQDCADAAALAAERFGSLDLVAHAAAILNAVAPIAEMEVDAFDRAIAVNVRGTMLVLRESLRLMIAQGRGGAIVCFSSIAALRGAAQRSAYGASKRAVVGLVASAALENGRHGIRVNAIAPGTTDTEIIKDAGEEGLRQVLAAQAQRPIPRLCAPSEQAALAAWLLSDEASFTTGALHIADGGATA